jgi:hypothetical protein
MENVSQAISWFAAPFLPPWVAGLVVTAALAGSAILLRRWRKNAADRALGPGPAHWPADIPTYRSALPLLSAEIARVRRNERSLAVLVLEAVNGQPSDSKNGLLFDGGNGHASARLSRQPMAFVAALMGAIVREALRECDIVTYDAIANHYVILLPDSDEEKARQAARRLGDLIISRVEVGIKVGIAVFPRDGLLLQALVKRARAACNNGAAAHPSLGARVNMALRPGASVRERRQDR